MVVNNAVNFAAAKIGQSACFFDSKIPVLVKTAGGEILWENAFADLDSLIATGRPAW